MYLPSHFAETRLGVLHALIRAHPLATIVTVGPDGPVANHIPVELDAGRGPHGTLLGHVARANPIWRDHDPTLPVLAVFQGPDAYVSPSFYPSKQTDARVVPTWNYAVVHVRGIARVVQDGDWLRGLVGRLTDRHESRRQEPWSVDDAPADYVERMLRAIVGFEIPIDRMEGKWKMSQNQPPQNRAGVVAGLRLEADPDASAVASVMADGTAS